MARIEIALATCLALLLSNSPAAKAHEFWIIPESGRIELGQEMRADLKVGRMLKGESYPYLKSKFQRFTVSRGGETENVAGFEGDIPALASTPSMSGLHVLAHQTVAFRVTYDDWSVFRTYLADEGLDHFADLHRERRLPETGFSERYKRYAKALVQVGPVQAKDKDVVVGMPLELVAEGNPYDAATRKLTVRLIWDGAPVRGRRVNIFRDDGEVEQTHSRTDDDGRIILDLSKSGFYLLNAVLLEPVENDRVAWFSHWATLSFEVSPSY